MMSPCTILELPTPALDDLPEEPGLDHTPFSRLLEWLDDGVESNGARYLEVRRRLVSYFENRDRRAADDLADETLNRIARTLEKDGTIVTRPPAGYCYAIAKFVLLEDVRRERRHVVVQEPGAWADQGVPSPPRDEALAIREQRLECLDRCLQELPPDQRALVVDYYREAGAQRIAARRDLARRLGITMNALGIRTCRIRADLEARVKACCREC